MKTSKSVHSSESRLHQQCLHPVHPCVCALQPLPHCPIRPCGMQPSTREKQLPWLRCWTRRGHQQVQVLQQQLLPLEVQQAKPNAAPNKKPGNLAALVVMSQSCSQQLCLLVGHSSNTVLLLFITAAVPTASVITTGEAHTIAAGAHHRTVLRSAAKQGQPNDDAAGADCAVLLT